MLFALGSCLLKMANLFAAKPSLESLDLWLREFDMSTWRCLEKADVCCRAPAAKIGLSVILEFLVCSRICAVINHRSDWDLVLGTWVAEHGKTLDGYCHVDSRRSKGQIRMPLQSSASPPCARIDGSIAFRIMLGNGLQHFAESTCGTTHSGTP